MKRKTKLVLIALLICALIAATFLLIPGRTQRDIGIDFGRLNDRVLVGAIALVVAAVLLWKLVRERRRERTRRVSKI